MQQSAISGQNVILNEVLPAPKVVFTQEWVELYNAGSEPVDLSGWKIDDIEGGSAPRSMPEGSILAAGEVLLITFDQALFNNSGDDVRLLRPDGTLADSFTYTGSKADQSYSRSPIDAMWTDTLVPSPGEPNPWPVEATPVSVSEETVGQAMPAVAGITAMNAAPVEQTHTQNTVRLDGVTVVADAAANTEAPSTDQVLPSSFQTEDVVHQPASLRAGVLTPAAPYVGREQGQMYRYRPPATTTALPPVSPGPLRELSMTQTAPKILSPIDRIRQVFGVLSIALASILFVSGIRSK